MKTQTTIIIILWFLLLGSCATRKVQKTTEKIRLVDTGVITEKAPGDVIFIERPNTPSERPKGATIVYKGQKGATASIKYDKEGFIDGGIIDCPEVDKIEQKNLELDYDLKEKTSQREFNEKLINIFYKLLMNISFIGFGAWTIVSVAKAFILRK